VPDILDEVEEDYRAERTRQVFARYGGLLIGLALLVVAGLGGLQGWRWWQARSAALAADSYLATGRAAAEPGADLAAIAARYDALAADGPVGYRTLALLRGAALKAEAGDGPGALAEWDRIARDPAIDPLYRDLASLLWALHGIDAADPATLEQRLAPLATGPWRASAEELRALVAIRQGDLPAARKLLTTLSVDLQAPPGVRDRAGRLLVGLGG